MTTKRFWWLQTILIKIQTLLSTMSTSSTGGPLLMRALTTSTLSSDSRLSTGVRLQEQDTFKAQAQLLTPLVVEFSHTGPLVLIKLPELLMEVTPMRRKILAQLVRSTTQSQSSMSMSKPREPHPQSDSRLLLEELRSFSQKSRSISGTLNLTQCMRNTESKESKEKPPSIKRFKMSMASAARSPE